MFMTIRIIWVTQMVNKKDVKKLLIQKKVVDGMPDWFLKRVKIKEAWIKKVGDVTTSTIRFSVKIDQNLSKR